jgi:AraC-like DNA-binding protein/mannose-6-phosphate isomerase-like protein (cupin superfamily)
VTDSHEKAHTLFSRTLPALVRGLKPARLFFDRSRRARRLKHLPERWAHPPKGFPPAHRHISFELCIVLSGRCPFLLGDERFEVRRGDTIVLSPDVYHRELAAENCGRYELLWMGLEKPTVFAHIQHHLGRGRFDPQALQIKLASVPEALQLAHRIDAELWENKPGAFSAAQGMLLQICALLERAITAREQKVSRREHDSAIQRWRAEKAAVYVRDHFAEPIDLPEVAIHIGASPAYASVLFTREIGRSFTDFLAGCRIEEAERLMADPALSIKEISRLVGIENPLYFSRLFRKHTGISPMKFRRKHITAR